jgi:hypothetical protein
LTLKGQVAKTYQRPKVLTAFNYMN